jgi:hypothetical protein
MNISMTCPGGGERLEIGLDPESQVRHVAYRDGTAAIWQRGEVFHRCTRETSEAWRLSQLQSRIHDTPRASLD